MKYVILISGKMQSGKNQFAEYLEKSFIDMGKTVRQDLYAKTLKDNASEDFKLLGSVLKDTVQQIKNTMLVHIDLKYSEIPPSVMDKVFQDLDRLTFVKDNFYEDKTEITRALLQLYGTEICRNRIGEHYFLEQLCNRVMESNEDVTLVTDVRFPNEAEGLYDYLSNDYRVIPVRVNRYMDRSNSMHEHESEKALDDFERFEYIINNNDGLEDLENKARELCADILKSLPL